MSAGSGIAPEAALAGFHRDTNTVRVDNVSKSSAGEVITLFSSLAGPIRSFQEIKDAVGTHLEIMFFNRNAATKALCMTGYAIGGAFLTERIYPSSGYRLVILYSIIVSAVTPIVTSLPTPRTRQSVDDRRNLYVLGLPFALTKNEFAGLFSRYGTVSHCVILATVDNSSRRRGFIVMSTHEEAKFAMSQLTRTQVKGHTIDVSWAVVQRSQGFLDGGDRAMLLDSRNVQVSGSVDSDRCAPERDFELMDSGLDSYVSSLDATTTLLVTKLPAILFSQTSDLEPLFCPFGHIKKLQVVGTGPGGTLSVLVQYLSVSAAQEAKEVLHGQNYVNCQVGVQFVRSLAASSDVVQNLCMAPPVEACNPFQSQAKAILNSSGICRQLDSYSAIGTTADTSILDKRPLHAIPNFPIVFNERGESRVGSGGSRWSSGASTPTQFPAQSTTADNFLANSHYHNLLA